MHVYKTVVVERVGKSKIYFLSELMIILNQEWSNSFYASIKIGQNMSSTYMFI